MVKGVLSCSPIEPSPLRTIVTSSIQVKHDDDVLENCTSRVIENTKDTVINYTIILFFMLTFLRSAMMASSMSLVLVGLLLVWMRMRLMMLLLWMLWPLLMTPMGPGIRIFYCLSIHRNPVLVRERFKVRKKYFCLFASELLIFYHKCKKYWKNI